MKDLQPLEISKPTKEDAQETVHSLESLLTTVQECRHLYETTTEYGQLNAVGVLGETMIASKTRYDKWENVLLTAVYLIENELPASEQALSEIVEQSTLWMDAAQTLAYLICGINGAGADETLRIARRKLGRLFEDMEHDAVCWEKISARAEASDYIRAFAVGRSQAIRETVDKAHQRFAARTEGQ